MRIAFVGAGSVVFTRKLVRDLVRYPALREAELSLHDIDPERLETARLLIGREIREAGTANRVVASVDRRRAVEGARYVICLVQVGGHDATKVDFEIPASFGIKQTIGDTLGLGGIFRALRTAPVLRSLAADLNELSADAWLLNYTNPMAALCWSVYADGLFSRVIGLCHSVPHTVELLAGLAEVPPVEVEFVIAGINHQAHVLRFAAAGEDLLPAVAAAIERDPHRRSTVRAELFRRFGYFQTESSEHAAEYVPWFLRHTDEIVRFRIPIGEYVRRSAENLARYEATRDAVRAGQPLADAGGSEYAPSVINALEGGGSTTIYGNVRNDALLPDLPESCCVEVACTVDERGVEPQVVGRLPLQLAALNRSYASVCELTVRAALEGRREQVLHAALLDSCTAAQAPIGAIAACVDALVAAHAALLPASIVSSPPVSG